MKNRLSRVQFLLFAMLLLALTGCGATGINTASNVNSQAGGVLTAKLNWAAGGKSTAKAVASSPVPVPGGIVSVRISVTGSSIPTAKQYFSAQDSYGPVTVYPGTGLTVSAQAFDTSGTLKFEGLKTDVTILSGVPSNVLITMAPPVVKETDTVCLACHDGTRDVSGQNLVANYKQSGHYFNNITSSVHSKFGANAPGCAGCHGTNHDDPAPATSGRCFECHDGKFGPDGIRHQNPNAVLAGVNFTARYLSVGNNNCSACHEPHNPVNGTGYQQRKDWALSGHGDTTAPAWTHFDFTVKDTCNACHTPGGFLNTFATNNVNNAAAVSTVSSGKQPLTCDACHSSNDFKNSVRTLLSAGYNVGMGGYGSAAKATIQFPNVGESNICIPCHASRENGASLVAGTADFTNANFKNPHYLGAAAVFYGKGGFQFYSSGVRYNTYGAAGKVGRNANWSHGKLGMDNFTTAASAGKPGVIVATGNRGQCVTCHLGPKNNHLFEALTTANTTQGTSGNTQGCYGCHNGTAESMADFINGERVIWDRAFNFFAWNFRYNPDGTQRANPMYYSEMATPYFFSDSASTAVTNWTLTVPGGTGAQTMGAALNLKLLMAEKGSFLHNRSFGRALIADSVVYLQKGTVGDRTVVSPTQNGIITFSGYSSAFPVDPSGNGVSISALKSLLTKTAAGGYIRR